MLFNEQLIISRLIVLSLLFLLVLPIHEFAHAWMADRLGDPTARLQGRLTLNPLAHLDPWGTFLPIFLVFTNFPIIFGWGKPVVFDHFNLQNPKRDSALISFAGPFSNLLLASILSLVLRYSIIPFIPLNLIITIFQDLIALNVMIAIFNLVPIHPLDGGKILVGLLPTKDAVKVDLFLQKYGIFLLLMLILPIWGGTSPIFTIILPIIRFLLSIYIPSGNII